jgi:hypothetical protein
MQCESRDAKQKELRCPEAPHPRPAACGLRDGVGRLVRPNSFGHLIFQVEFPLLQRLLFDFFVTRDLRFRRQFLETIFTPVMFFDPLPELGVLLRENSLNVSGTIRHRMSSLQSKILALRSRLGRRSVTVER